MKKIYTIRDISQQQSYMWDERLIEDEVKACDERGIKYNFLRYLPKEKDILEAGCGLGAWVVFLSGMGYRIAGIDHDLRVIERLKKWNPSLNVAGGDIEHLPYKDNSLGAYISLGVVEHFEEGTEKPLREAYRVLMEGGIIFLTVPFDSIFRRLFAHPLRSIYLLMNRLRGGKAYFAEYRYTEVEVINMLEKAGFQVIETDIDDFIGKTMSMTLWSEFPFLRGGDRLYSLNLIGRLAAFLMNSISRKIVAAGILVIARKTL